jgi:hypothetical protein
MASNPCCIRWPPSIAIEGSATRRNRRLVRQEILRDRLEAISANDGETKGTIRIDINEGGPTVCFYFGSENFSCRQVHPRYVALSISEGYASNGVCENHIGIFLEQKYGEGYDLYCDDANPRLDRVREKIEGLKDLEI